MTFFLQFKDTPIPLLVESMARTAGSLFQTIQFTPQLHSSHLMIHHYQLNKKFTDQYLNLLEMSWDQ
jgi:hypothetical protein